MTTFKVGDRVRSLSTVRGCRRQGEEYVVARLGEGRLRYTDDEGDLTWGPASEFENLELATQPLTILDDAGRAALKAGDEVLIRLKIITVHPSGRASAASADGLRWGFATDGAHVYALLTKAPEPIAVGDKLRSIVPMVFDVTYTCVGFTTSGLVVAQYDAGDTEGVMARDASTWEKVK